MSSSNPSFRHPLSPASPPHTGLKEETRKSAFHPSDDILPSPPYMSVATKSYASHTENNRYQDEMAQRPPPSPVSGFSQQSSRQANGASSTPTSNPLKRPLPPDEKDGSEPKRAKVNSIDAHPESASHAVATNHDRLEAGAVSEPAPRDATQSLDDRSDSSDSTKRPEGLFLIGRSVHTRPGVDLNSHLLGTYGLGDLVKNMARLDPQTGEKINKLRKSYEGQIKMFGLPGRNKTHKSAKDDQGLLPLRKLVMDDDATWEEKKGKSKIKMTDGMRGRMDKALKLHSGRMGKVQDEWDEILGHDSKKPSQPPLPVQATNQLTRPSMQNGSRIPQATNHAVDKMKTRGKKRSYDDSSFHGYTGFDGGGSDAEDGHSDHDYNAPRKRKKD